jgi:hypothetical protein
VSSAAAADTGCMSLTCRILKLVFSLLVAAS